MSTWAPSAATIPARRSRLVTSTRQPGLAGSRGRACSAEKALSRTTSARCAASKLQHAQSAQETVEHLGRGKPLGRFVAVQVHVELDIGEIVRQLVSQVNRERGLAYAGGPGDGGDHDRSRRPLRYQSTQLAQLHVPTGEAGDVRRELVGSVQNRLQHLVWTDIWFDNETLQKRHRRWRRLPVR